jgi:hypothetical protein
MDLFKNCDGEMINLDDMSIYSDALKVMNVHDLFSKCMDKAGHSLFYMDYLHKDIGWEDQKYRVSLLCNKLSDIWNYTRKFEPNAYRCTLLNEDEYRAALLKWLYKFEDETENQC